MKKNELIIITEIKRLIDYVFVVTQKSPKKYRYSFVTKIHNILLDIIELLYVANSIVLGDNNRLNKQKEAIVKFQLLDYMCDLAHKEKCLLFSQYENISKYINSCLKLLNAWIARDQTRISNNNN